MRDLFGHAAAQVSYPGKQTAVHQRPAVPYRAEAPPPSGPVSRRNHYYHVGNRAYSRDELLTLSGFHQACADNPDDLIVVVLYRAGSHTYTMLAAFPRSRPDGLPPLWKHGEVMEVSVRAEPG